LGRCRFGFNAQQYVGEKEIKELILDCYYIQGEEKSNIYEDANDGYGYKKGDFSRRSFRYVGKDNEIVLQQYKRGKYKTSYETFKIRLIGIPFKITSVQLDNEVITPKITYEEGIGTFVVTKDFTELHIEA